MSNQQIVELISRTLMTAFWLSLPILAVGFVMGIVMSVVQVLTSIQDSAFGNLPKLAAFLVSFLFLLPWMLSKSMSFAISLIGDLSRYAH